MTGDPKVDLKWLNYDAMSGEVGCPGARTGLPLTMDVDNATTRPNCSDCWMADNELSRFQRVGAEHCLPDFNFDEVGPK